MNIRKWASSSIVAVKWSVVFLFAVTLLSCESDMTIKTDGKNPPSFSLSGSGRLISFAVMEVTPENQSQASQRGSDANTVLWEIEPTSADNKIWWLPMITYGKIPAGFVQKFPANGSPPAPLVEGNVYEAGGPAYGANGALIRLEVQGNKTIQVASDN